MGLILISFSVLVGNLQSPYGSFGKKMLSDVQMPYFYIMEFWTHFLAERPADGLAPLDTAIPLHAYVPIDLSVHNKALVGMDLGDASKCQNYIDALLGSKNGQVAFGGYLEERNLYTGHAHFNLPEAQQRNVHLGIDFWCAAGTTVVVPIAGRVHSFKNNNTPGDYGPTIILEHQWRHHTFHTLYGHLSLDSLEALYVGREFLMGDVLARLGTPEVNVGYAPHLHFQIILDIQGHLGDYPGVAAKKDLSFYQKNCPDPKLLLPI